ncbi:MAG: DUF58 domain-containing protein [Parvularculaceae bacterium]
MIYPTARAALLAGAGAVFALALAAVAPGLWLIGLAAIALVAALMAADAWLSPWPSDLDVSVTAPASFQVGRAERVAADVRVKGRPLAAEMRLETNALIDVRDGAELFSFMLTPLRRGGGEIKKLWVRWRGPFGLVYKQLVRALDREAIITSDTRPIEKEAISVLTRENLFGERIQRDRGEGAEFDSLREFRSGMDPRAIDWKHTARHRSLLTREFRTEKNHSIVFAFDTGRLMCEPVAGGISRLDHALNAALLMSFISLKLGDRVGFFAFDARPRIKTGVVSGPRAFALLQKVASGIDYTEEETNYTLGLTELSARLDRRTLIVLFTDFADTTSAELMLANLAPMMKRHLVLFVAFRDDELEHLVNAYPEEAEDVTRAVIADSLLRERDLVIAKLQRMGALIVDAPSSGIGPGLINQYLAIKRRNLL